MIQHLWLIGAGLMGRAYARTLSILHQPFSVIGRGEFSAANFEQETGVSVIRGSVDEALERFGAPSSAIVAVQEVEAYRVASRLIEEGTGSLLLEKPAGLSTVEVEDLLKRSLISGSKVWVAYNRRFYASVHHARRAIETDGGLVSVSFDFTEFSTVVRGLDTHEETKRRWLIANSSHVIDLVFHLAGVPVEFDYRHSGHLDWHPAGSRFAGSGVTDRGVLFSYLSDWEAPGRWGVELRTTERKLMLRPLESLLEMVRGSLEYSPVAIDDGEDQVAKPGLLSMTRAFLAGNSPVLCSLEAHAGAMHHYSLMAGYSRF